MLMINENRIRMNLSKKIKRNIDKGKYFHINKDIKTSVDFIFEIGGVNFLFEIDSNNAIKIIFGQYLLLNKVKDLPNNPFLVIVHCFKNFNKERTIKHLNFAKDNYGCKIPFAVLSESEWIEATQTRSERQINHYLLSLI